MAVQEHALPPLPPVGRPESFYAQLARDAEQAGHVHAHEAAKVGQYITLALDPKLSWEDKAKYFRHALRRHCQPPPMPDESVALYYSELAELVRKYAGEEALRLASTEDDMYAARVSLGQDRSVIEDEAEVFFGRILGKGDEQPECFNEVDWAQLKLLRDQWI